MVAEWGSGMPVVPEDQRLDALRRLGLSDPLVRLSAGEPVHPVFEFRCEAPPYYSYNGAAAPDGPPFVPLWDCCGTVTGVWALDDGPEFIKYSIEADGEYDVLARTEQGLWANLFNYLLEDEDGPSPALEDAARVVGFRYYDRVVTPTGGYDLRTFEGHQAWLNELVADIDRQSGGPAR